MSENQLECFKVKGRKVRIDEKGRICLNDIHKAGGFSRNQTPSDWQPSATKLIVYTLEKTTGKSGGFTKAEMNSVYCTRVGRRGGTWAHPILALAYAKYLSPALHYEVNEVFLRYKSGDASLADETLQRSSPEENERVAIRALGRAKRNVYTETLKQHGVTGFGYAKCTDETYRQLFGAPAKELRIARQLPANANMREHMDTNDLVYVMAAEVLATDRIEEEGSEGSKECRIATGKSAGFIRQAILADRANRKKKSA